MRVVAKVFRPTCAVMAPVIKAAIRSEAADDVAGTADRQPGGAVVGSNADVRSVPSQAGSFVEPELQHHKSSAAGHSYPLTSDVAITRIRSLPVLQADRREHVQQDVGVVDRGLQRGPGRPQQPGLRGERVHVTGGDGLVTSADHPQQHVQPLGGVRGGHRNRSGLRMLRNQPPRHPRSQNLPADKTHAHNRVVQDPAEINCSRHAACRLGGSSPRLRRGHQRIGSKAPLDRGCRWGADAPRPTFSRARLSATVTRGL